VSCVSICSGNACSGRTCGVCSNIRSSCLHTSTALLPGRLAPPCRPCWLAGHPLLRAAPFTAAHGAHCALTYLGRVPTALAGVAAVLGLSIAPAYPAGGIHLTPTPATPSLCRLAPPTGPGRRSRLVTAPLRREVPRCAGTHRRRAGQPPRRIRNARRGACKLAVIPLAGVGTTKHAGTRGRGNGGLLACCSYASGGGLRWRPASAFECFPERAPRRSLSCGGRRFTALSLQCSALPRASSAAGGSCRPPPTGARAANPGGRARARTPAGQLTGSAAGGTLRDDPGRACLHRFGGFCWHDCADACVAAV